MQLKFSINERELIILVIIIFLLIDKKDLAQTLSLFITNQ
jgi:hypothetical protein